MKHPTLLPQRKRRYTSVLFGFFFLCLLGVMSVLFGVWNPFAQSVSSFASSTRVPTTHDLSVVMGAGQFVSARTVGGAYEVLEGQPFSLVLDTSYLPPLTSVTASWNGQLYLLRQDKSTYSSLRSTSVPTGRYYGYLAELPALSSPSVTSGSVRIETASHEVYVLPFFVQARALGQVTQATGKPIPPSCTVGIYQKRDGFWMLWSDSLRVQSNPRSCTDPLGWIVENGTYLAEWVWEEGGTVRGNAFDVTNHLVTPSFTLPDKEAPALTGFFSDGLSFVRQWAQSGVIDLLFLFCLPLWIVLCVVYWVFLAYHLFSPARVVLLLLGFWIFCPWVTGSWSVFILSILVFLVAMAGYVRFSHGSFVKSA